MHFYTLSFVRRIKVERLNDSQWFAFRWSIRECFEMISGFAMIQIGGWLRSDEELRRMHLTLLGLMKECEK